MRTCWITAALLLASLASPAQKDNRYPVAEISPDLLPYALAVVRENRLDLTIRSPQSMEARYRRVLTVLNPKGGGLADIVLPYDPFNRLSDISCLLYDAEGQVLKKYSKKDFLDFSYLDDLTMAQDSRYLQLDLSGQNPPFTLALEFTLNSTSAFFCPDFMPQPAFNTAVENAACTVHLAPGQHLLYKGERCPAPQIEKTDRGDTYSWVFGRLPAIPDEPYNLPLPQLAPVLRLNPGDFQIGEFSGSFRSWDGFAGWSHQMLQSLPPLSAAVQQDIQRRTAGQGEREKIRTVYRFLQNNTRYVSVQLGIGGWKPFDPNFVHAKKYGDCKALSWYAKCLLDAAGIPAWYTLVSAGDAPRLLDPDFPYNSFNHVILTVPTSTGDTLFLECTSQTNPFGYVGTFTGNRKALMIGQGQGRIVDIPAPAAAENLQLDSVYMTVDSTGAQLRWTARFAGTAVEEAGFYRTAAVGDEQERQKWAERYFTYKGSRLEKFDLQVDDTDGPAPSGRAFAASASAQLLHRSSKRLYFQPNFFQTWTTVLPPDDTRVSPVYRRFGRSYTADLTAEVPEGWQPERLPADVEEQTPFGRYTRQVVFSDGRLHYRRTVVLEAGAFPAADYSALAAFFKQMKKWDGETAVFVRD